MERKFTDEEVIRALHICENYAGCCSEYCPMIKDNDCRQHLMKQTKDLINRQRAEIERLKWGEYRHIGKTVLNARNEGIKDFAERLRHTLVINNEENDVYFDYAYTLETIDNLVKEMTESKPCTEDADCSTCENCYHDGGYNECATDGVKL